MNGTANMMPWYSVIFRGMLYTWELPSVIQADNRFPKLLGRFLVPAILSPTDTITPCNLFHLGRCSCTPLFETVSQLVTFLQTITNRITIGVKGKAELFVFAVPVYLAEIFFVKPFPSVTNTSVLAALRNAVPIHSVLGHGILDELEHLGYTSVGIDGYNFMFLARMLISFYSHYFFLFDFTFIGLFFDSPFPNTSIGI